MELHRRFTSVTLDIPLPDALRAPLTFALVRPPRDRSTATPIGARAPRPGSSRSSATSTARTAP